MLPYEEEEERSCEYVAYEGRSSFPAQEFAFDELSRKAYDNVFVLLRLLKCIHRECALNPEPEIPGIVKMIDFSAYHHHMMVCCTTTECSVYACFQSRMMFNHWTRCWHSKCFLCAPLVNSLIDDFLTSLQRTRPLTINDYIGIFKYKADLNLMKLMVWKWMG